MDMLFIILLEAILFVLLCILVIKYTNTRHKDIVIPEDIKDDVFKNSPSVKNGRPMSKYVKEDM